MNTERADGESTTLGELSARLRSVAPSLARLGMDAPLWQSICSALEQPAERAVLEPLLSQAKRDPLQRGTATWLPAAQLVAYLFDNLGVLYAQVSTVMQYGAVPGIPDADSAVSVEAAWKVEQRRRTYVERAAWLCDRINHAEGVA